MKIHGQEKLARRQLISNRFAKKESGDDNGPTVLQSIFSGAAVFFEYLSFVTETLLVHDHSELDAALVGLVSALADGDAARSLETLDLFWARLAMHIRAENLHLFPALLRAAETSRGSELSAVAPEPKEVGNIIAQLRDDHDFFMTELTAAVKQLRALCHDDRTGVLAQVREKIDVVSRRLETHNALEESRVYHWAALLLDPSQQMALNENIRRELQNVPPRFRTAAR